MSTLAHKQSMFLAAIEEHCPEVVQGLVDIHEARHEDEKASLRAWCVRYKLLDLGEPCPWILEVGASTLRLWREVPSTVGHWDLPEGDAGWSTQERPSVPELAWSDSAPLFVKARHIEAVKARLAEIERTLPKAERSNETHFRWLALAKVRTVTREVIAAKNGNVSAEAVKQALRTLKSELQLRDAPGRPKVQKG